MKMKVFKKLGCYAVFAFNEDGYFWQQISRGYTTINRLNTYFCKKNGYEIDNDMRVVYTGKF